MAEAYEVSEAFEEFFTSDVVAHLKLAALSQGLVMVWEALDGSGKYGAMPAIGDADPKPIEGITAVELDANYNAWKLFCLRPIDVDGVQVIDIYFLMRGYPLIATRHLLPGGLVDGGGAEVIDIINTNAEVQDELGVNTIDLMDYAAVDNALFDMEARLGGSCN